MPGALGDHFMVKRARRARRDGGGRGVLLEPGGAVRPLLGRARAASQPAFRNLLPPGHRVLHRARHPALRARHAGRAQGEPRLRAGQRPGPCTGSSIRASARPSATICGAKARTSTSTRARSTAHVPYRDARLRARSKSEDGDEQDHHLAHARTATASGFHRSTRRWTSPKGCSPPVATSRRPACWPPTGAESFPGIRPASRCCGGRPIRARCWCPAEFRCSRSLGKTLRNRGFEVTFDRDFAAVVDACAARREHSAGTWITPEMRAAYCELHARRPRPQRRGAARAAHWSAASTACCVGRVFFGESMFSRERDASKVALARLAERAIVAGLQLIDCQLPTPHLRSLGSKPMARLRIQRAGCARHRRGPT